MRVALPALRIALCGLGAALTGAVVVACFDAYLDPSLILTMTISSFLCQ